MILATGYCFYSFPFLFRPYRAVVLLVFTGTGRYPVLFYVALSGQKKFDPVS
jgi:hypothetical protein